ncbi:hypothetical protein ACFWA6_04695, partial [Streptomyces sp. NPDC060020]|uniref:hypothetical protein n=1 Tax=Streptomyces sp. NPDC060020 TaxID=3347038 RepID=UPI00369FAF1D
MPGTPVSRAVDRLLSARIKQNAFKAWPATRTGVMVSGGGYQGASRPPTGRARRRPAAGPHPEVG